MLVKLLKSLVIITIFAAVVPVAFAGSPDNSAHITIPALDIDMSVSTIPFANNGYFWDTTQLGTGIGHLEGTPWFSEPGNVAIGGHYDLNDGSPGGFYELKSLEIGDTIIISQGDAFREYRVVEFKLVDETDISVVYTTPSDRLTLFTCDGFDPNTGRYEKRFVVIAEPVS